MVIFQPTLAHPKAENSAAVDVLQAPGLGAWEMDLSET